jgi:pyrimidine deaminase RibD-like protein
MKLCNCIQRCDCGSLAGRGRRGFLASAAAGLAAAAVFPTTPAKAALDPDRRKFMQEATRLATESVQKGWGDPFGAVIVKDGEIIGRGQNRVLLTGCPVYHAEVTAIIDASDRLNPKGLLGSDYGPGTMLQLIPRPADSPDLVPERAKMLKGCEIWWIPTRSATPSTALVPQRKAGFPIPNGRLLLGFQGTKTARREGVSSPFSDAGGCTSPQNSGSTSMERRVQCA